MAKIQVLDVQTANRIAAGEVVERPASVAKELLENALDAGATAVTLEIREGGIAYLRVTDNGAGIAPEDCRLAFERHATSKIRSGDDLAHIGTLGFRGEALPSIAAVSRVELTTRTEEAAAGVRLQVEAGRFLDVREAGCPKGTTFVVRDLFFNTPARRKFLKRPATEAGYVADVATELALSRPEIAVRFVNNGKVVFQTVGNGDLRSAIYVLHGREVASEALPFSYAQGAVRASGFVGVGNLARSNRSYELFFVNGRFVRDSVLSSAVEAACHERVMIGKYPYCVLNLSIPAEAVDVNVHPNKLEVRFKEDFPVREHVQAAVEAAFADGAAPLRAVAPSAPDSPPPEVPPPADADAPPPPEQIAMAQPAFGAPETPAAPAAVADFAPRREGARVLRESSLPPVAPPMPWRESAPAQRPETPTQSEEKRFAPPRVEPLGTAPILIGQIFSTYLLVQRGDALLIIDQHAAHERILYEKFRRQVDEERRSQPLLTPYLFDVTLREAELLTENLDRLRSMGFEIEPFGERAFRVSAVPVLLGAPQTREFFVELLDQLDSLPSTKVKDLKRDALVKMACKKAIKGGDTLSAQEVNTLLALVAGEETPTCPHGRPILIPITKHDLERKFKRIQ